MIDLREQSNQECSAEAYIKRVDERLDTMMSDTATLYEALSEGMSRTLSDLVKMQHNVGGQELRISCEVMRICDEYLRPIAKQEVDDNENN